MIVRLPPLHEGQKEIDKNPARFKVVNCGRRWGKTKYGVYVSARGGLSGGRIWWVSVTYKQAREGWDYLVPLARQVYGARVRESEREILWPGGGRTQVRSADNPASLRGAGLDGVVLDECAYIAEDAWTKSLRPALSDKQGWALFISTPRGRNWFYRLFKAAVERHNWAAFTAPSITNPYLDPGELEDARQDLSSAEFRQEYEASFEAVEGALWQPSWIDDARLSALPQGVSLLRTAVAIDPAVTANDMSDETAIAVLALGSDGHYYVLNVSSYKLSPRQWASRALDLYAEWDADVLAFEVNNGGDLVESVIRDVADERNMLVNYEAVRASKGKVTRAEPCAAQYEKGRVHHLGYFNKAEDQMVTFPIENERDDLVDALVWSFEACRVYAQYEVHSL